MAKGKKKTEILARTPVVGILGHIDHGKTTLLDYIRKSNLQAREVGGITQHIGAYQINHNGQKITFIDTPGHAAFGKMRARGAGATDLVILVVAADEGVKPQTKESYSFIKEAKVPFLVAITKMDLPSANINLVKDGLARIEILTEDRGGEIVVVPVSAKTGEGIEELLEMIILVAQMQEPVDTSQEPFEGVVIESRIDRSRGPVGTVVVKRGVLRFQDQFWVGLEVGRVKAMEDQSGQHVTEARPGDAVLLLGFSKVPEVGEIVAGQMVQHRSANTGVKKGKIPVRDKGKLAIIVKADARGTLEAILGGLPESIQIIESGVGAINENDISLAQTTKAVVKSFNMNIPGSIKKLAEIEGVKISTHKVIYELFDEVNELLDKKKKPGKTEEILGEAEIRKKFHVGESIIAGGEVLKGRLASGDMVRLIRGEKLIGEAKIESLHQGREKKEKIKAEQEFGALIVPQLDFRANDMLVSVLKLPSKK